MLKIITRTDNYINKFNQETKKKRKKKVKTNNG